MALTAWLLLLVASLTLLYAFKIIIRIRTSSLSKIPSPGWGAAYSRLLWAFPREFRGTLTIDLPRIHERLGPLVQIGPNEVSFYSIGVYDLVHKINSGFIKDPQTYGQFVQNEHPALFSIVHPEDHSRRRRMMGQLYSRSKVPNLESLLCQHIDAFVKILEKKNASFDIMPACRALEADIMSEFSFGKALGAVDAWESEEFLGIINKNDEKAKMMPLLSHYPLLYEVWTQAEQLACWVRGRKSESYVQGLKRFDQWSHEAWSSNFQFDKQVESPYPNLVRSMTASGLPRQTALSEAKENLGPGTDTTSGSLAHILYALAHNPQYQQLLYEDLSNFEFSTDMSQLERIPRLKACIKEGIRWAGTAAAMLPRIVPPGGVELHGQIVPGGTVLSSSPIWYLRDKKAFPEPDLFNPYRWIDKTGQEFESELRDQFYIPFSKGTNICIGLHFSYYELYLSVSKVIQNFRVVTQQNLVGLAGRGLSAAHDWKPVQLPKRKEWVAAVLLDPLLIQLVLR